MLINRIFSNVVEGFFIPYRIISLVLQKSGNLKSQIELTKKSTYLIKEVIMKTIAICRFSGIL
jgi:hypothetical protein